MGCFVIHERFLQKFRKNFATVPACESINFFSFHLFTYDYTSTEMSFVPYSITNSMTIIYCGYTVVLRMLEQIMQFVT